MNESLNHWLTRFVQTADSFKKIKQVAVFINESLNHWLTRFVRTADSFLKWSKWLFLWTCHWIIDSLDSVEQLIHFENEASGCFYEWVTESLTDSIRSNSWFISKMDQVSVFMNKSLNHWLTWFCSNSWFILKNEARGYFYEWVTESLTHSICSNSWFISKINQVTVFMNESLNHVRRSN